MSAPEILSTGSCFPTQVVTNEMLAQRVDTSDEWVFSRTGIHSRRHCSGGENGVGMAAQAARQALERAGVGPEAVSVCLVATFTPDFASPSTACLLQRELGLLEDTICFDLNAACAGFVYALHTAHSLLSGASRPYALVLGCEVISRVLDMDDRSTCVLFGDGAGAVLVRRREDARWHTVFGSRGDDISIRVQGPGPEKAAVHMEGQAVFRFAVEVAEKSIRQLLEQEGIGIGDLDWIFCHQANARITEFLAKRLKADASLFYQNIEHCGNTSAASIPLALYELQRAGGLHKGMRVLLVGFGGGLTWAGALLHW